MTTDKDLSGFESELKGKGTLGKEHNFRELFPIDGNTHFEGKDTLGSINISDNLRALFPSSKGNYYPELKITDITRNDLTSDQMNYLMERVPILPVGTPVVSVIMAAYNAQDYIKEAIDSILNQSFTDFELIIVNDGSTDNTERIVLEYNDPRIVFVNNPTNVGCSGARQKAIMMAKAPYIAIADSDDISYSDRLAKQLNFICMSKLDFTGAWCFQLQDVNGNLAITGFLNYAPEEHKQIRDAIYSGINCQLDPTSFFKRSAFFDEQNHKHDGYDFNNKVCPDWELWCRRIDKYRFGNLPEFLVGYRKHNNNNTYKYSNEVREKHVEIHERLILQYKQD